MDMGWSPPRIWNAEEFFRSGQEEVNQKSGLVEKKAKAERTGATGNPKRK
jgi:hypothetical protein